MQFLESREAGAFVVSELLIKVQNELIQDPLLVEPRTDRADRSGSYGTLRSISGYQNDGDIACFIPCSVVPPSENREVPRRGQRCIHDCITTRSMPRLSASQRPLERRRSLGLCQASPPGTCAMA